MLMMGLQTGADMNRLYFALGIAAGLVAQAVVYWIMWSPV